MLVVFFIFSISLLILMDGQVFPYVRVRSRESTFEAYNDEEQLRMLQEKIEQGRLYQKNFKEFGNSYRVDLFIQKAFSKNHPEAYTGKVFWSGITGYNGAFLSTGIFRVSPGTQFDFLVRSGVGL